MRENEIPGAYPRKDFTIKEKTQEPKFAIKGLDQQTAEKIKRDRTSLATFAAKLQLLNYVDAGQVILDKVTGMNEEDKKEVEEAAKLEQEREEKIKKEIAEKRKQELDIFVKDLSYFLTDHYSYNLPIGIIKPSQEQKEFENDYKVSEENIVPALEILGVKLKFQKDGSIKTDNYATDILNLRVQISGDFDQFNKKRSDTLFVKLAK